MIVIPDLDRAQLGQLLAVVRFVNQLHQHDRVPCHWMLRLVCDSLRLPQPAVGDDGLADFSALERALSIVYATLGGGPVVEFTCRDSDGNVCDGGRLPAVQAVRKMAEFAWNMAADPDNEGKDPRPGSVSFTPAADPA